MVTRMLSHSVFARTPTFRLLFALFLTFFVPLLSGLTESSVAEGPPAHLVSKIEVLSPKNVRISEEDKAHLQTQLLEALKSEGFIAPDSPLTLLVMVEGFLVRSGNTPTLLRQQGGRDILRGSISLRDQKGVTQIDKMKLSFSFEGFENLSPEGRRGRLFTACTHSVIDALK
jgi:hypothetical protein